MAVRVRPSRVLNQRVRSADVDWVPLNESGVTGVAVKVLRFDEAAGRAPTILLKFEAGRHIRRTIIRAEMRSTCSMATSVSARIALEPVTACTRRPTTRMPCARRAGAWCW